MLFTSTRLHISWEEKKTYKTLQLSRVAVFLRLADWRCQALSLACCAEMSWLHAARMAGSQWSACSLQLATSHQALANSLIRAGCRTPLSVCVWLFVGVCCMCLLCGLPTLAVRYILNPELWDYSEQWMGRRWTSRREEKKQEGKLCVWVGCEHVSAHVPVHATGTHQFP